MLLFYFWLSSADLAIERVADRVRSGGHFVPHEDIRRRYDRSISNLRELYIPLADFWFVFDNSSCSSRQIAEGSQNPWTTVYDKQIWELINGVQVTKKIYETLPESQPTVKDKLDSKRFYKAIRQGSVDAIAMHAAAGRTIAIWKDGQVVQVPAEELIEDL